MRGKYTEIDQVTGERILTRPLNRTLLSLSASFGVLCVMVGYIHVYNYPTYHYMHAFLDLVCSCVTCLIVLHYVHVLVLCYKPITLVLCYKPITLVLYSCCKPITLVPCYKPTLSYAYALIGHGIHIACVIYTNLYPNNSFLTLLYACRNFLRKMHKCSNI